MSKLRVERTLCYMLRHKPEEFGVELDNFGYASIPSVCAALEISEEQLRNIVAADEKRRYSIVEDYIRCNFGHSIPSIQIVDTGASIPSSLLHGTKLSNLESIFKTGLRPGSRQSVHMTSELAVAVQVGLRYAKTLDNLVILEVDTAAMQANNLAVRSTGTSTYLAGAVPAKYISISPLNGTL